MDEKAGGREGTGEAGGAESGDCPFGGRQPSGAAEKRGGPGAHGNPEEAAAGNNGALRPGAGGGETPGSGRMGAEKGQRAAPGPEAAGGRGARWGATGRLRRGPRGPGRRRACQGRSRPGTEAVKAGVEARDTENTAPGGEPRTRRAPRRRQLREEAA